MIGDSQYPGDWFHTKAAIPPISAGFAIWVLMLCPAGEHLLPAAPCALGPPAGPTVAQSPPATGSVALAATAWRSAVLGPPADPPVLLAAIFPDGYAAGDADEAVQVWNLSDEEADLSGWSIHDGRGSAGFSAGAHLAPGDWWWLARDASAFQASFGHLPDWTWGAEASGVDVGRMVTTSGGPALANHGDSVSLLDANGHPVDTVVYGDGSPADGWSGEGVSYYRTNSISAAHQVIYRKLDGSSGFPVPSTGTAADWSSDPADAGLGRRARFPGWDLEGNIAPLEMTGRGRMEVAVAPDALFEFLSRWLASARSSIDLVTYTLENPDLAEVLAERAGAGVAVRLLLDGSPVGGVDMNERWCAALLQRAGGSVYWMDDGGSVRRRYRSMHAKLAVIDGRILLLGSENPNLGSTPSDDFSDGTAGRRGVFVALDVPGVVHWAELLVARDLDPENHVDLRQFQPRDPQRGAPASDFEPERVGGGAGYRPRFRQPLAAEGAFELQMQSSPESSLTPGRGLLGLLARAGEGDEVLVEQMTEPVWWGAGPQEGDVALNPRVAGYAAAARRGARVRILLDGYFADPGEKNGNYQSVEYLNDLAVRERIDLSARLGNPAGGGLHNKMVLVRFRQPVLGSGRRLAGLLQGIVPATRHSSASPALALASRGVERRTNAGGILDHVGQTVIMAERDAYWVHLGSINGSEVASKVNREVAINIGAHGVYQYLARVFAWDWAASRANALCMPVLWR